MTNKRILSFLLALAIAAPQAAAFAADPADPATETPEVTVVGKRIIGDDTYFEISLEVSGDYEDYTAVDVTLEYDPAYIVPADSWDDEAGAADMTECTSWATRRALPTLGKDTWKTHTALTYISQKEVEDPSDSTQTIKVPDKGYLYLGAEYNSKYQNTDPDPAATADPDAPATPEPAATAEPTPAPTADPENKYANPVVAVRFMYTGADADAKKAAKADLIKVWTEKSGAQTKTYNEDWYQGGYASANPILRIAPDSVCLEQSSPSKYGFAYSDVNFDVRAFLYDFPAAAAAVTATGNEPRATFAPGSEIAETDRLKDTDIEIVTDEGKSAKSGGLTLNDVFAIIFLDWDNSIIGALTAAVGAKDMAKSVNSYVNAKLIHEELRMENQNYENLVSSGDYLKREFSYRGEYPYDKPSTSNPTVPDPTNSKARADGANYPLTNKLDYVFAGKDIDPTLPFANGWVQVSTKDMDYSSKPGHWSEILPKNMNDAVTWWANLYGLTYGRAPELDTNGNLVDSSATIPEVILYDFDNITEDDLDYGDGTLFVKAAYEKGASLNGNSNGDYSAVDLEDIEIDTSTTITFSIKYSYRRLNQYGYGVYRVIKPAVNMAITQLGAAASTPISLILDNGDLISVELTPTDAVETVGYTLKDTYLTNIVAGAKRSFGNEFGIFSVGGASGLSFQILSKPSLEEAYTYANGATQPKTWLSAEILQNLKLSQDDEGTPYTKAKNIRAAQTPIVEIVREASGILGDPGYLKLSWYQLQYAVLRDDAPYYVDNATAKAWCEQYPALINVLNNGFD